MEVVPTNLHVPPTNLDIPPTEVDIPPNPADIAPSDVDSPKKGVHWLSTPAIQAMGRGLGLVLTGLQVALALISAKTFLLRH